MCMRPIRPLTVRPVEKKKITASPERASWELSPSLPRNLRRYSHFFHHRRRYRHFSHHRRFAERRAVAQPISHQYAVDPESFSS
ncbi:hypothetical protein PAHAL_9G572100 [Panicum hallii]|uniref:Uncharacterized protein n=1 Tax=Panicum hallii TaxID=206008 RepID=A0A2T8I613_9POAL|nr:hypothetical protein PAHAL_9G572100 [Panicum hallii]